MKKILSAVLMMIMIVAAATLAGSALAAEPYEYTPGDGLPVVYVSSTGNVNASIEGAVEKTTLDEAYKALSGKSGYIVLLENVNIGRSGTIPGGAGDVMVTYVGRNDLADKVAIEARYMCSTSGNVTFENLNLAWNPADSSDNDNALRSAKNKLVIGNNVVNSGSAKVTLTGGNIEINSGSFHIRLGQYAENITYDSVNITLNGGSASVAATHAVASSKTTVNGDVNITINGGSFTGKLSNPGTFTVKGNYNVIATGGSISGSALGTAENNTTVAGLRILDTLGFPAGSEKDAFVAKAEAGAFDLVMTSAVYLSDNGDDSAAGTVDAPVATYEKAVQLLGSKGGVIIVSDIATVEDITEATRSSTIIVMGVDATSQFAITGDFSMGGPTVFRGVTIANGGEGAIVANGKALNIMSDVSTSAIGGKYIDIVGGKRGELVAIDITVSAGTYQNILPAGLAGSKVTVASGVRAIDFGYSNDYEMNALNLTKGTATNSVLSLSEFINAQAAKISPVADAEGAPSVAFATSKKLNGASQPFVRVEYYVNSASALGFKPVLTIGGNEYVANEAAVAGWNIATFEITDAGEFTEFTYAPYGEYAEAALTEKLYITSFTISHFKNTAAITYDAPRMSSTGDFIPVLDDFVMGSNELVNTSDISGLEIEATIFTSGNVVKITPTDSDNTYAQYYSIYDGDIVTLNGEFRPFVRVEYYVYAREGDDLGAVNPTLLIGDKVYTAPQALVTNKWGLATFDISDINYDFTQFTFLPYGASNTLNEWNKMYVNGISFSQTENLTTPVYQLPDMTEDGEIVPYIFDPAEEGLEVLPVVYYARGGLYNGDAAGSKSSLYAFGSVDKAVKALEPLGGGYVILTTDYKLGSGGTHNHNDIPADDTVINGHNTMIILRGMDKEDGKVKFSVSNQPRCHGPLWIQNLIYESHSNGDTGLNMGGAEFKFGTPGAGNDDVTMTKACDTCAKAFFVLGGDGYVNNKNINATFYSGTYNGALRVSGGWNPISADSVTITFKGGNFDGMSWANGHVNLTNIAGDVNVTIEGGSFNSAFNFASTAHVKGGLNLVIKGNPTFGSGVSFTAAKSTSSSDKAFEGTRTVDILGYEGDFEALKSKINASNFDVLNIESVYIADGGSGDGKTPSTPVGKLSDALAKCAYESDGKIYGGRIVIAGNGFTVEGTVSEGKAHSNSILYTSYNNAQLKFASGTLSVDGPVRFSNITLNNTNADDSFIQANGNELLFESNVKSVATEGKYVSVIGGKQAGSVDSVNVTVDGGTFQDILTGDSVTGDVSIVINGGTIKGSVVGGSSVENGVIGGNVSIDINDGNIDGSVIGGNTGSNAVVEGVAIIEINGGKFGASSEVVATNRNATATVGGNGEVTINAGDFTAMREGGIQPGDGTCGDKICVDYKYFDGTDAELDAVESAVASTFDVIIVLKQDAPVFTELDKFMFIIEHIGDPTMALTKRIPLSITQTNKQTSTPIVVSPKQLNVKMDGSNHANMTIQNVGELETIRYTPNHQFTTGNAIVNDGYNINGRGVDVARYKYIEVVYYYTVPEGETPAVENMAFRPLSDHSSAGTGTSGKLEPNKWTTTLIDMTEQFNGKTGALKQYHFYSMGYGKKATDVPESQFIDIASLTFYTDKPNTIIKGAVAPNSKAASIKPIETKPAAPKVENIKDIVVNVVNLKSTVDNSGSFTANSVSKDGMTVMEYTPVTSSDKDLRIEGYNCMGNAISLNEYQYLTMKIFVETAREDVKFTPQVANCNGGVQDNPEKAKSITWNASTPLIPNQWNTVTLKIAPADPSFHITRQFHIAPIGMIKASSMVAGEKFYLAEFVLSAKPPKAPASSNGDEVVEVEQEIIEEAPAVVVDGAKLINSAGDYATFKSAVTEFDGKKVVAIRANKVPGALAVDGSAIFGKSEQTPDGALSLKTHRYAIISYYYASQDDADRIPEFDLLGGRIQNQGNVVNGVTAKGTEALKRNEWATVVVKLSGNGAGVLTSGFNFKPFGDTAAANINSGDVLYIENITFVSNRP